MGFNRGNVVRLGNAFAMQRRSISGAVGIRGLGLAIIGTGLALFVLALEQ